MGIIPVEGLCLKGTIKDSNLIALKDFKEISIITKVATLNNSRYLQKVSKANISNQQILVTLEEELNMLVLEIA